jgi:uncharacterized NAD(P)/FAD-binding protein YdhS
MQPTTPCDARPRITIVGGGFTAASAAVQLVRHSAVALHITVIEPREQVGPGLAYSTLDPEHRINGPLLAHSIDPTEATHFAQWCEARQIFAHDPQARLADGSAFVRRADFGRYLIETVREHARHNASASTLTHLRDRAIGASLRGDGFEVTTTLGHVLAAPLLLVATGNTPARWPAWFDRALDGHGSALVEPLAAGQLDRIHRAARVLVVGSGLTALDVLSTLLRRRHEGHITVVSRHGLRPRPQAPFDSTLAARQSPPPLHRVLGDAPAFLLRPGVKATALDWLRALRAHIRAGQQHGLGWHAGFDELRDVVWRAWPLLPIEQKRRFLRRLRVWYDVHRFRAPPQNDTLVNAAVARGQIEFRVGRVLSVEPGRGTTLQARFASSAAEPVEPFDAAINCTGLDGPGDAPGNALLSSLVECRRLRHDDSGLGFAVDAQCRAIGRDGRATSALRVFGPPTAGVFGDPLGVLFIAAQIHRALPDMLRYLSRAQRGHDRSQTP